MVFSLDVMKFLYESCEVFWIFNLHEMENYLEVNIFRFLFCKYSILKFRHAWHQDSSSDKAVWFKKQSFHVIVSKLRLIFSKLKVIVSNFRWTWKHFGYYLWSMKSPNIFMWLSFAKGYRGLLQKWRSAVFGAMKSLAFGETVKKERLACSLSKMVSLDTSWGIKCRADVLKGDEPSWIITKRKPRIDSVNE